MASKEPSIVDQIKQAEKWLFRDDFYDIMRQLYLKAGLKIPNYFPKEGEKHNFDRETQLELAIQAVEELGQYLDKLSFFKDISTLDSKTTNNLKDFLTYYNRRNNVLQNIEQAKNISNKNIETCLDFISNAENSFQDAGMAYISISDVKAVPDIIGQKGVSRFANQGSVHPAVIPDNKWLVETNIGCALIKHRKGQEARTLAPTHIDLIEYELVKSHFDDQEKNINKIFIPVDLGNIRLGGSHWVSVMVFKDEKGQYNLSTYDSFREKFNKTNSKKIKEGLKNSGIKVAKTHDLSAKHQDDGHTCGFRTVAIGELFLDNKENFLPLEKNRSRVEDYYNKQYGKSYLDAMEATLAENIDAYNKFNDRDPNRNPDPRNQKSISISSDESENPNTQKKEGQQKQKSASNKPSAPLLGEEEKANTKKKKNAEAPLLPNVDGRDTLPPPPTTPHAETERKSQANNKQPENNNKEASKNPPPVPKQPGNDIPIGNEQEGDPSKNKKDGDDHKTPSEKRIERLKEIQEDIEKLKKDYNKAKKEEKNDPNPLVNSCFTIWESLAKTFQEMSKEPKPGQKEPKPDQLVADLIIGTVGALASVAGNIIAYAGTRKERKEEFKGILSEVTLLTKERDKLTEEERKERTKEDIERAQAINDKILGAIKKEFPRENDHSHEQNQSQTSFRQSVLDSKEKERGK